MGEQMKILLDFLEKCDIMGLLMEKVFFYLQDKWHLVGREDNIFFISPERCLFIGGRNEKR